MSLYNFSHKHRVSTFSRQWWTRVGVAAAVVLTVALFIFSSKWREAVLGGLYTSVTVSFNLVVDAGRFSLHHFGVTQNGVNPEQANPSMALNRRQLMNIWLGWGGVLGVLLPALMALGVLAWLGLRKPFRHTPALDDQNLAQFEAICQRVGQALWRNLIFDAERVLASVVALGLSLFLFQFVFQHYFQLSFQFVLGFILVFIGYSYIAHARLILHYNGIYQKVIRGIETNLCLKQGLVTLLGVKPRQAISRFYCFLLADMTQRLEKLNLSVLFPHRLPQLTRYNFGFPLLVLITLASLVSAAIPRLSLLVSEKQASIPQLVVSSTTELDEIIKQEAEKLQVLSEELASDRKLPKLDYVIPELEELSQELVALSEMDLGAGMNGEMYASDLFLKVSPSGTPMGNFYWQQATYNDESSESSPTDGVSQEIDSQQQVIAQPEQNKIPPETSPSEAEQPSNQRQLVVEGNQELYRAIAGELNRLSEELMNPSSLTPRSDQVLQRATSSSIATDQRELPLNMANQLSQEGDNSLEQPARISAEDILAAQYAQRLPADASPEGNPRQPGAELGVSTRLLPERGESTALEEPNQIDNNQRIAETSEIGEERRRVQGEVSLSLNQLAEELMNLEVGHLRLNQAGEVRVGLESGSRESKVELLNGEVDQQNRQVVAFSPPRNIMVSPQKPLGELPTEFRDWAVEKAQVRTRTGQAQPLPSTEEMEERVKVNAMRLEMLGETLLLMANPQDVALDAKVREYIAPKLSNSLVGVSAPEQIQNNTPELSMVLQDVRNPQNIDIITSELNRFGQELSNWQLGNRFAGTRPGSGRQAPDELRKQIARDLVQNGGINQADREALMVRGQRLSDTASMSNSDLERLRLEESPSHVPHNRVSNISMDLERIGSELINWDAQQRDSLLEMADTGGNSLVPVESLARKLGLPELINSGSNRLQTLANQLPQESNPRNIERITNQMAELGQQVGNLSLNMAESLQRADNIPDGTTLRMDSSPSDSLLSQNRNMPQLPDTGLSSVPEINQSVEQQLRQNGELLLEMSNRLQLGLDPQLAENLSSDMLATFNQLGKLTGTRGPETTNQRQAQAMPPSILSRQGQQLQELAQELRNQPNADNLSQYSPLIDQITSELRNLNPGQNARQLSNYPNFEQVTQQLEQVTRQLNQQPGMAQIPRENLMPVQGLVRGDGPTTTTNIREAVGNVEDRLRQLQNRVDIQDNTQQLQELGMELVNLSQGLTANLPSTGSSTISNNEVPLPATEQDQNIVQQVEQQARELGRLSQQIQNATQPGELRQLSTELQGVNRQLAQAGEGASPQMESQLSDAMQLVDRLNGELTRLSSPQQQASQGLRLAQMQQLGSQLGDLSQQLLPSTPSGGGQDMAWDLMDISRQLQRLSQPLENQFDSSRLANGDQSVQYFQQVIFENEERLQELTERLRANPDTRNLNQIGSELGQLASQMSGMQLSQMTPSDQAARDFNSVAQGLNRLSQEMLKGDITENNEMTGQTVQGAVGQRIDSLRRLNQRLTGEGNLNRVPELAREVANLAEELREPGRIPQPASNQQAGINSQVNDPSQLDGRADALSQISQQLNSIQQLSDFRRISADLDDLLQELGNSALGATRPPSSNTQMLEDQLESPAVNPKLMADLARRYGELRRLNLSSGELANSRIIEEGEQLEAQSDLSLETSQVTGMASRLNELATQLMEVNSGDLQSQRDNLMLAEDRLFYQTPTEIKRQQALNRLDQALRQLRQHQSELEELYNDPAQSSRRSVADNERRGQRSGGTRGTANELHLSQGNLSNTGVAREINAPPQSETISNVYPMEENLYQQDALKRIIKRIENHKELISQVDSPSRGTTQLPTYDEAQRREGPLPQPQVLELDRIALTPHEMANPPKLKDIPQLEITPITEEPISYEDKDVKLKTGFIELSIKTDRLGKLKEEDIPLDKTSPRQKVKGDIRLTPEQVADESVLHQQIPQRYREIIEKIFLSI